MIPGRAPQWKHWSEAATLESRFKFGEGSKFQDLLDNIGHCGHDDAAGAWDALAGFAVTSSNPGALTMTMLGMKTDGVSYHTLAACLLAAREGRRPLAKVLRECTPVVLEPDPIRPAATAPVVIGKPDWRALVSAAPDPVMNPHAIITRVWRTSEARPVGRRRY